MNGEEETELKLDGMFQCLSLTRYLFLHVHLFFSQLEFALLADIIYLCYYAVFAKSSKSLKNAKITLKRIYLGNAISISMLLCASFAGLHLTSIMIFC